MHLGIAITIFTLSFLLFLLFITKNEKQEGKEKYLLTSIITSAVLSLIVTAVLMFFVFIFSGATSFFNMFLKLGLDKIQLGIIVLAISIYMFTVDYLLALVFKHITNHGGFKYTLLFITRFSFIYLICILISVKESTAGILSLCVTAFLVLAELLYYSIKSEK
jgi:hypothetical protein